MDIVVAMKQIPDLQQVRVKDGAAVLKGVPLTFGDIDKRALEAAVELRDAGEGTVHILSVGSADLEDTVDEALAAGGDDATLLADDDFAGLDSSQAAAYLAWAIGQMDQVDLVLLGEASGDGYSGQVASRVSALLGWPLVGYAEKLTAGEGSITAVCSYEDHTETVEVATPAVVSVASEIAEVRIPRVSAILKAGRKPKEVLEADDVDREAPAPTVATVDSQAPSNERRRIRVGDAGELVAALKSENLLVRS